LISFCYKEANNANVKQKGFYFIFSTELAISVGGGYVVVVVAFDVVFVDAVAVLKTYYIFLPTRTIQTAIL
jgi:hypothetical protein